MKYFVGGWLILVTIALTVATVVMVINLLSSKKAIITANDSDLKIYMADELKKYDGSDGNLPIYLAMDGYVYDVTMGAEFYRPGGVYHFLAGKDSTSELRIAGGTIIKRKYKIVGRFVN